MLTILTKIIDEKSLRYRINESIHRGTYLGGKWLTDKVKSLELRAWLKRGTTYIDFPEDNMARPAVTNNTVVREVKKEETDKERGLYYGNPAFEFDGKLYPVQKGFATYVAYPSLELNTDYAVWSDEHKRWIDVTKYFESKKCVSVKEFVLDASVIKSYERWNTVKRWHRKMTSWIYDFLHTIDSCYLCLKYPFLYPRNRFTGNHYNNWKIIDYCNKLEKESVLHGRYKEWKDDSKNYQVDELPTVQSRKINEKIKLPDGKDRIYYFVDKDGQEVVLYDRQHGDSPLLHLPDGKNYMFDVKFGWVEIGKYAEQPSKYSSDHFNFDHDDYVMHYVNYIMNPRIYKKMKMIRWLHDNVLARIFFIPTHNEIDAMDDGWFRAFGMQLLDELKTQLKKDKMLYKYRIMQIKEKFGCYDEETEVLTKNGFKHFRDVNSDDEFATLNEVNEELEYQKATDIISYKYDGLMYELRNRGVDIKVTPNHNLYVSKGSYFNGAKNNEKREYSFELTTPDKYFGQDKRFKKGCLWTGIEPDKYFKVPDYSYTNKATSKKGLRYDRTYTIPGPTIELIPFLRFLGFYVAEGYASKGNICVAYNPADEEELVTKLINDIGFKAHSRDNKEGIKRLYSAPLEHWLRKNCGHLAPNKKCPEFIKNLPSKYIEEFLTYLFIGDGHKSSTSNILTTTSSKLKDDVCELLLKAGYAFRVMMRNRRDSHILKNGIVKYKHLAYDINWLKLTYVEIDNSKEKRTNSFIEKWVNYSGNVYCVTVPNHIIYVRRNGKGYWCGNSLRWYDSASSQEVFNILQKYEDNSYHTCISCGRPADYITSGYILPFCKNCIKPQDIENATDLHAKKKDDDEEDA